MIIPDKVRLCADVNPITQRPCLAILWKPETGVVSFPRRCSKCGKPGEGIVYALVEAPAGAIVEPK